MISAAKLGERVARLWGRPRGSPPARAEVGGPLDAINDQFHDTYGASRQSARREVPVFVILADALILFHRDTRQAWSFAPRSFHVIKSVAHAPLAIYAALEPHEDRPLDLATRERLAAQRAQLADALGRLAGDLRELSELSESTRADLRTVLEACADFLSPLPRAVPRALLSQFAGPLGPLLLRLADDATGLQLDALHAHTEEALCSLSPEERAALHVVVAGDHQARERSLALQYFQRRLGEPRGVEQRVSYAEGVSDEQGALALVGTRRLDRAIGRAFFGDAHRLQRDILGDAAHARLERSSLTPIA